MPRSRGGRYLRYMRGVQRITGGGLSALMDAGIAAAVSGLIIVLAWGPADLADSPVAGPSWLLAVLPLLIGVPLVLRRRAPLLTWVTIWIGISLQVLVTRLPPPGLEVVFALCIGGYSLGAYSRLRRVVTGLAVAAPVIALASYQDIAPHSTGSPTSGPLLVIPVLASWLGGVFVRVRKEAASLARRNAALELQAREAVVAERARIARELHDIVAHHISVVVLQAAGARASGRATEASLEKIERSGRQALAETRRLLEILRDPGEEARLVPQPGVAEVAALADSVRAAGVPVSLAIDGDCTAVPPAVGVSVYRIVQEALTNILKHAGPARADVIIDCGEQEVTIEVTDDGAGPAAHPAHAGGQGLTGMRERVAIFGGELHLGPGPGGGFAVRARLPRGAAE